MPAPHACTIASNNYLALARVFAESYKRHHPEAEVYVCIADRPDADVPYGKMPFVPIFASELGIPNFENFAFRYDILELNTAVKPFLLAQLRDRLGLDRVLYFDPDILVLSRLDELERLLETHPAILTPHITRGLSDAYIPSERDIRMAGIYNLGFVGLRLDAGTRSFLEWWQERLYRFCLNDIRNGIFVDQGWMDFAPAFLEDVAVARSPAYNVAYWNLAHRPLERVDEQWRVEGVPVGFVHFSGLDFGDLTPISRHQNRVGLAKRPELRPLFERYRDLVRSAGHEKLRTIPYGYRTFETSDVPIPWVARRLLQRVDPLGHRWPNPYDIHRHDSYLEWLTEPIEYPGGTLTRTALALWEERDDLIRAFPDVCGADLPRYADWLVGHGEGARAGLHTYFTAPVRARHGHGSGPRRSTFGPELHPYATASVERATEVLAKLDLSNPGAFTTWLNEPLPGVAHPRPVITRLALLLYKVRHDVQSAYPDPLEVDQAGLADWFCRHAALEFHLHRDLVQPVLQSLPFATRLALTRQLSKASAAPAKQVPAPLSLPNAESATTTPPAESSKRDRAASPAPEGAGIGVNLAAYFDMDTGVGQMGRGSALALGAAEIPFVRIHLDEEPSAKLAAGRIHHQEGAPHTVTLVHANADETPRALSLLPLSSASYRVGYWFWELSHFPLAFANRFELLDEVWAPTRFCQASFEPIATIPVHHVPPCVPRPEAPAADRSRFGVAADSFVFLLAFDVASIPERKNPFAAIEAFRRMVPRAGRPVSLLIKISRANQNPELVARLSAAAKGLPIRFHTAAATRAEMDSLVAMCDANLSVHRSEGLGLLPIEFLYLGKPVVATGYGGVTDFLDETTGYAIDFELIHLDQDHPPYPRGAVWADPSIDHAAEQMLAVLGDPQEAARRGAAGRERVESIYGVRAAAARYRAEIERIGARLQSHRARPDRHGAR